MLGNVHKGLGLILLLEVIWCFQVFGNVIEIPVKKLVRPYRSTADGDFITYDLRTNLDDERRHSYARARRSTDSDMVSTETIHRVFFSLYLDDVILVLNLTMNDHLVGPDFTVETVTEDGIIDVHSPEEEGCFYVGHIEGDILSEVAISNCEGMNGVIKYHNTEYIIEPENQEREDISTDGTLHKMVQLDNDIDFMEDLSQDYGLPDSVNETILTTNNRIRRETKKYYAEVIVNVDYSMQDFHRNQDLHNYVLTLMNIVDQTYHHRSMGLEINFVVTKIVKVGQTVSSNMIAADSMERSLAKACAWSSRKTYQDNGVNKKADVNIYLTRLPTKRAGYALLGTMCEGRQSCMISHDSGLRSALVMAHEIGHLFGFEHDGDHNGCQDDASSGSIMADKITSKLSDYFWSSCSTAIMKKQISGFKCLHDNPFDGALKMDVLPGQMFTLDDQCYFMHGGDFSHCPWANAAFNKDPCELLLCSSATNRNYCLHDLAQTPPLEGTECDSKKWCKNGLCVTKTTSKPKIKTVWEINGWTECSKTCGKGLTYQKYRCRRIKDDKIVNKKACDKKNFDTKSVSKECNPKACPTGVKDKVKFSWKPTKWSDCSTPCGVKGKQTRKLRCMRTSKGKSKSVNNSKCKGKKPQTKRNCNPPCRAKAAVLSHRVSTLHV